ncbi:capsular biosynthesis protein [Kluyvera sp. EC_51]|uniref:capsule biosynthesis protein n=1 Tax=Kluyvera sp. EC_51 TaxID=2584089 RepID=UPI001C7024F1|nr:capsular biosynthesis protein [Kluyvera sp. EC_51]MBW9462920.1 capsular biosynthesis protein [Kluyvera sp. EC_51]
MESTAMNNLLAGKRYLLLQGPMGPFFSDLAGWLESKGREAVNVVFNGGDHFYCRQRSVLYYTQTPAQFARWLKEVWQTYPFDTLVCFGDCRPLHQAARQWANAKGLRFLAFEEGYLRPHFITLEVGGVNAYSSLPQEPDFYRQLPEMPPRVIQSLKPSTRLRYWHATWYYLIGWFHQKQYPHYRHHKSFSPWYEMRCWIRAWRRKHWYAFSERHMLPRLQNQLDNRFYLAILQVYNDSQIRQHSPYNDVREYINDVIYSFATKAPATKFLVFKHHPMDRGHRLYAPLIKRLSKKYGVRNRVLYVHDLPMPEMLKHAKAMVTINSTAGLSALIHNKSLKVMGDALYDMKGLTYQGHLHQFWTAGFRPDMKLLGKFRGYLLETTQINEVFYGKHNASVEQPNRVNAHAFIADKAVSTHRNITKQN